MLSLAPALTTRQLGASHDRTDDQRGVMSVELEPEPVRAATHSDRTQATGIHWRRVLIEGLTIVASILLAFGIDAGWDARHEAAKRRQLLADLRSDFTTTQQLLTTVVGFADRVVARSSGFMEATVDPTGLTPDSIGVLASGLSTEISFTPAISHYRASLTTGDIGRIRSDSLLVYLNRFDLGLQRYLQHDQIQAQLFYLGAVQDLRLQFGGIDRFVADNSAERTRRIMNAAVSAAAEPVAIVQVNLREAIQQMSDATRSILTELDRLQNGG
jgi:hypothetical protein